MPYVPAADLDGDRLTWRNGMAVGDGSWLPIEEYRMVPR
jgi:hypothetical protein